MGITNIERMVTALVNDEMNYMRTLSHGDVMYQLEGLLLEKYEAMTNDEIIEEYERLA